MLLKIRSIAEYNKNSADIIQKIFAIFYENNEAEISFLADLKDFKQFEKDFVMFDICGKLNRNKKHPVRLTMSGNHYKLKEIR